MTSIANDDFCSLAEEKFDFDVSLSPASAKGDEDVEDEVFVGPVSDKERCISHGVETTTNDILSNETTVGEEPSCRPLFEENFEEICREANSLASYIERTITGPVSEIMTAASILPENAEKFEVDSSAKLGIFSKPADALSPIKRETFCVQDSPMKQLPPAIQKKLQKLCGMSGGKPGISTSSPVRSILTQPKLAPQSKSLLPSRGLVSSKPLTMANSRLPYNQPAPPSKTRLPPPSKAGFGLKRSPGNRSTSNAGSTEDLLSDATSVASDVSDSSFNTSLPGKRALPVPNKSETRGTLVRKTPLVHNRRVLDRSRNTSSSSSSVSSVNSSLSVSPTGKGKLSSSLNTSMSSIGGRVPSSGNRLPNSSHKSGIISKPLESSVGRRTSLSIQGRKNAEPQHRPVKATPIKRPDPVSSIQHQMPAKKTLERAATMPGISILAAKTGNTVKVNSSLKAFVAPTPTNSLKGVHRSEVTSSPDVPRIMKPKRLMSASSMESIPQRLAVPVPQGLQTPSAAAEKPVQSKLRRPSALPTPVSRRVSGIPMLTPKSVPRLSCASHTPERQSPASSLGIGDASPRQLKQVVPQGAVEHTEPKKEACVQAVFQPCSLVFSLEEDADRPTACGPAAVEMPSKLLPSDLTSHQPKPDLPKYLVSEGSLHNNQLKKSERQEVNEVLLVDVPAPVMKPEEKVLIDLSNTPDLMKTIPNKAFGGQLIDLSSPLIKWSPEENKKNTVNEAPLINLSF
ncbi:G2 and S phase-expressed protein 1 isoform X1 [Electrophorus electricus]|uniref:G2 and S phase-expressed protein 1 N-terminal domain-containing protein n=1 Tax=Electrophorus electricus TaxID=8005 RepID=A0A4W4HAT7_ELEEL|nr:G2 and S phase-expressed protein 1 isoform X1 [Electrophorus electricus]